MASPTGRELFHTQFVGGFESPCHDRPEEITMKNSQSVLIEVSAAEGGDDAKMLVNKIVKAYTNVGARRCL